jgi:hypothetical protein
MVNEAAEAERKALLTKAKAETERKARARAEADRLAIEAAEV